MPETPAPTWIRDPSAVAELGRILADAPWIALDSESNSMFVYREQVCLIQINVDGIVYLIDTLALPPGPEALAPLASALTAPDITVYLHGGEYDVACLKRDYDIALGGVFDTQQAASFLGLRRSGYGAVVAELLDIELAKGHAQFDWATRPLPEDAVRYACDDVVYLPQVADILRARITDADLEEELAIANRAVMAVDAHEPDFDPTGVYRLKGQRHLGRDKRAVLFALYCWRDRAARAADRPPGRIIGNERLVDLARRSPTNYGSLRAAKLHGKVLRAYGDEILSVIKEARAQPPKLPPPPEQRDVDEAEKKRETRLKDWRRSEAERRSVPLQAILPAKALDHLKRYGGRDLAAVPQLGPKRIARYGDKLQALTR